jgi:hypothetical protein
MYATISGPASMSAFLNFSIMLFGIPVCDGMEPGVKKIASGPGRKRAKKSCRWAKRVK